MTLHFPPPQKSENTFVCVRKAIASSCRRNLDDSSLGVCAHNNRNMDARLPSRKEGSTLIQQYTVSMGGRLLHQIRAKKYSYYIRSVMTESATILPARCNCPNVVRKGKTVSVHVCRVHEFVRTLIAPHRLRTRTTIYVPLSSITTVGILE